MERNARRSCDPEGAGDGHDGAAWVRRQRNRYRRTPCRWRRMLSQPERSAGMLGRLPAWAEAEK